jgi:glutathione S-transferase
MRARLALAVSQQCVELREVVLKDKPEVMLEASAKGTVPVLLVKTEHGKVNVIDESLDIMLWALEQSDPAHWLPALTEDRQTHLALVTHNDTIFKLNLDRYKYADRFPVHSAEHYRSQGEKFLQTLEDKLTQNNFLFGSKPMLSDFAIFPFIRQFALVDKAWFDQSPYPKLQTWLRYFLDSALFKQIMPKFKQWVPSEAPIFFNPYEH